MNTKKIFIESMDIIELIFIIGCIFVSSFFICAEDQEIFFKYMNVLFLSAFMSKISSRIENQKISLIFLFITVFVMSFMYVFRDGSGIDDIVYKNFFYKAEIFDLKNFIKSSNFEIGYTILNYLIFVISNGKYEVAQIIFSIFPVFLIEYTLWEKRRDIDFTIATLFVFMTLLYFIMSAALVRIFISVSIVIYSYRYIIENKPKRYVFGIFIASTFHISSLFMLVLLLLLIKEEYFYRNIQAFSCIILVFIPLIFLIVCKYIVPLMSQRYSGYSLDNSESGSILSFIDRLPFLFIGFFFYRDICNKSQVLERECKLYIILILLSISVNIASIWTSLGRCVYYTNYGVVALLPLIIKAKSQKKDRIDRLLITLFSITLIFFYIMYTIFLNPNIWIYLKNYQLFI